MEFPCDAALKCLKDSFLPVRPVRRLLGEGSGDERISAADVICLMQVLAEMEVHGFARQAAEPGGNG